MMSSTENRTLREKLTAFVKGEVFSYLFFGGCTTVINILVFQLFYAAMGIPTLVANAVAWAASVAFAYVTNRIFVFHSKVNSAEGILREVAAFVGARVFSLLFDELIMWLMVDIMGYTVIERLTAHLLHCHVQDAKSLLAKLCSNVVVVVLNFVFSKLFIFKKDKT